MSRFQLTVPAALLAGALVWGCGNASVPAMETGSITGQVTDPGPITTVRLRQIITEDVVSPTNSMVNTPVNSDGTFTIPSAPQGPSTLEFMDNRQIPYSYAEVVVQPDAVNPLAQPVMGPGPVPSPDPSVNGTAGALKPGFTGPIDPTASGTIAIRAFGPNGQLLSAPATVALYTVNLQGGPTTNFGQNPAVDNPGLVGGNMQGTPGASVGGANSGGSTAGATNASGTNSGALNGATNASATAGATNSTAGSTAGSSAGSSAGAGSRQASITSGSTATTGGAAAIQPNGTITGSEQGDLNAQTVSLVTDQSRVLAQVQTNPSGVPVTISGIPTGAPGIVTPGAATEVTSNATNPAANLSLPSGATPNIAQFLSQTDASGNVTLTPLPGAAPSFNQTGGGYQLVPRILLLNGQTLYARQVLLDALPGVVTHVDLRYSSVK